MISNSCTSSVYLIFFFNDTATTEIYTLSLHDALPILKARARQNLLPRKSRERFIRQLFALEDASLKRAAFRIVALEDRKSTRLNSSHANISYAVFCLKKKKIQLCAQLLTLNNWFFVFT